ncbi:MAG: gamma-glutamylcyclotransferase family protein [Kofleriaceae bacterium]
MYGTLLAGERNHHYLERARLVGAARTKAAFALHHLGAFPGLVAGGAHAVAGEVYEVDEPTLAALDRLEDHPDFYRRAIIELDDDAQVVSYLLLRAQVEGHPVILSGSWRAR